MIPIQIQSAYILKSLFQPGENQADILSGLKEIPKSTFLDQEKLMCKINVQMEAKLSFP